MEKDNLSCFVDLTEEDEHVEEDDVSLQETLLSSFHSYSPSSTTSTTSSAAQKGGKAGPAADDKGKKKAKKKKKVVEDEEDDDDSFLLAETGLSDPLAPLPSFSSTTPLSTSSSSTTSSSSSASSSAPKRKRVETKGKEKKSDEEEDEEEERGKTKAKSNKASAAPATKEKAKPAVSAKKKRKKSAPEEDVLVLLDANLLNEPGGDEYLSCLRSPLTRDKKPVLCDVRSLPVRNSIEWRTSYGMEDEEESEADEKEDERRERLKRNKKKVVDSVIVKYSGAEFGQLVRTRGLREEVDRIKAVHADKRITILVEGLKNFFAQESRRANRELRASGQAHHSSDSESEEYSGDDDIGKGSGRKVTKSMIADAIVWLQIEAKCHVRKTDTVSESANYVYRYTCAIANAPYKQESSFSTFCAEATGKRSVKTATIGEIWIKQLQQINKVSVATATAIANAYPTFRSLMSVYQSNGLTDNQKDIKVGTLGKERRIGQVTSRRIYHFFTDKDGTRKVN